MVFKISLRSAEKIDLQSSHAKHVCTCCRNKCFKDKLEGMLPLKDILRTLSRTHKVQGLSKE